MTNNYPVLHKGQIMVWRNCLIKSKKIEIDQRTMKEGWTLLTEPDGWLNKHPTNLTWVPESIANTLTPGNRYNLLVQRQNKKKAEHSGTWDWMFYYGLIRVATPDDLDRPPEEAFVPEGPSPQQTYTAPAPVATTDVQKSILLMNATDRAERAYWHYLQLPEPKPSWPDYLTTIAVSGTWLYQESYLNGGYVMPPEVEEGSTQPTEAPEPLEPTEPTTGAFSI